jgi:hypothetical protein
MENVAIQNKIYSGNAKPFLLSCFFISLNTSRGEN